MKMELNIHPADFLLETKAEHLNPQKCGFSMARSSGYPHARFFKSVNYPDAPGSFAIELWEPQVAIISVPLRHEIEMWRSVMKLRMPDLDQNGIEWTSRLFVFADACDMVYTAGIIDCDYWLDPVAAGPMVYLEMYLRDKYPDRFREFESWEELED